MRAAAERMKGMRHRRRGKVLREVRLVVADARLDAVRDRVAGAVARLDPEREAEALRFIETAGEFDTERA